MKLVIGNEPAVSPVPDPALMGTVARAYVWAEKLKDGSADSVREIAKAEGVSLSEDAMVEAALRLGEAMFDARSSTAQDLERGKATEIESLNGYIAKRGDELGIGTPINRTLYALVKLLEQSAAK